MILKAWKHQWSSNWKFSKTIPVTLKLQNRNMNLKISKTMVPMIWSWWNSLTICKTESSFWIKRKIKDHMARSQGINPGFGITQFLSTHYSAILCDLLKIAYDFKTLHTFQGSKLTHDILKEKYFGVRKHVQGSGPFISKWVHCSGNLDREWLIYKIHVQTIKTT